MRIELTPQSETELKTGILELVGNYLEAREKVPFNHTGLITQQQLKEELGISFQTLTSWEQAGLRRYQPPLEDTRKVFYRISDILIFLGVEE
ncbi:XRE family transcriptional regulator [Streptococcus merionis]|uniref:XRE family transcriptional regulator n=1 Tax=Streptococcus merionis TaxID=400065 RepID=UPI0035131F10